MTLGILLPLGETFSDMKKHGQDVRFVNLYLANYCKSFSDVYVFSYAHETYPNLPSNCHLICPKHEFHRYFYALLLPFLHSSEFKKCDVFRCFHPSSAIPAILAKITHGKKFIFNYNYNYTDWAVVENKAFLVPFIKIFEWLAFKTCNRVFVADERMQKHAKGFVPERKITIIRNGVDIDLFKPQSSPKIGLKTILSVGRLEIQKNYSQLINAVSLLKSKNLKLQLIGNGTLRSKLIQQAQEKSVNLEILDVVPHTMLPKFYNQADVYVQPSLLEAPVKTLLEAMSCARPCVATDVAGIQDVLTDRYDGLLANLTSADLANKIALLLTNRLLAMKLGAAARKKIALKYDLKKILELETRILKSI